MVRCEEIGSGRVKDGPDFGLGNQGSDGVYL